MSRRPGHPARGRGPGGPRRAGRPHEVKPERLPWVRRPFEGLASEADLVALREVVPSATAPLTLTGDNKDREVLLATVLPLAWSAMVRRDGAIVLALQTPQRSGDTARDLGQALSIALTSDPGSGVGNLPAPTADDPRLHDLIDPGPITISVHDGFDWWIGAATDDLDDEVQASLQQANASVVPTTRLSGVDAAYWCRIGDRTHLRWALPQDEDRLLDAFARMHLRGELALGEGTKYIGAFRALGLLVPVWDLRDDSSAEAVEPVAAAFQEVLEKTLTDPAPLTPDERRARAGVVSRQVTLR